MGKWKLVQRPVEYKWSSANFYEGDGKGYVLLDYRNVLPLL